MDYARVECEEALCRECGSDEKIVDPDERLCARCTDLEECANCHDWVAEPAKTVWGLWCEECVSTNEDPLDECLGCERLFEGGGALCPECEALRLQLNEAVTA